MKVTEAHTVAQDIKQLGGSSALLLGGTEMIKTIFKIILTLTLYEAAKYITEQLIIRATQNDDVEAPADFNVNDHIHLNHIRAEVSK